MDFDPLMATLTVHVLSGVFWAGPTSAMANLSSVDAARLRFRWARPALPC